MKYVFFAKKCSLDDSFQQNGFTNTSFNFQVEAFQFLKVFKSIHVHCVILVCTTTSKDQQCVQECLTRRRRSDTRLERRNPPRIEQIEIETSYAIVYKEKLLCKDFKCPANSMCLEVVPNFIRNYFRILISTLYINMIIRK